MWKGYLLYEVNYVIFQKRKNYGDSKKVSKNNCQRLVSEKGENRKNTEDFRPQWWIHLSKPIESTMPRVSHNTNCGLWAMMHDCRFICGNKGTTLAKEVCSGVWKIPWMEEPVRLQTMGSLRVRNDWVTSLSLFTFMHWRRKWQPTPVLLPGKSYGRRSLVGCSPWGR